MTVRTVLKVIAVVGLAHLTFALAVWWVVTPEPRRSRPAAQVGQAMAAQRLAELYAMAAFRSVITHDYAALNEVIKQAAAWPEVLYVSVEDPRGKILAHTEPSMVGRVWTSTVTAEVRATARAPFEEIAATMVNPSAGPKAGAVGQIRLGYGLDAAGGAVTSAPPGVSPAWILVAAALAAIPVGLIVAMLAHSAAVATHRIKAALDDRQLRALGAELLRERTEAIEARHELERLRARLAPIEAVTPATQPIFAPGSTSVSGRSRTTSPAAS